MTPGEALKSGSAFADSPVLVVVSKPKTTSTPSNKR